MTRSPHAASSPIMVSDAAPRGYAYVASIPEILGDRATPTLKLLGANRLVVREAMLASPTPVCIVLLAREVDSVRASGVSNSRTIGSSSPSAVAPSRVEALAPSQTAKYRSVDLVDPAWEISTAPCSASFCCIRRLELVKVERLDALVAPLNDTSSLGVTTSPLAERHNGRERLDEAHPLELLAFPTTRPSRVRMMAAFICSGERDGVFSFWELFTTTPARPRTLTRTMWTAALCCCCLIVPGPVGARLMLAETTGMLLFGKFMPSSARTVLVILSLNARG
mmetsp:Transcript_12209/g.28741  ORF Transcript_12209/g.28741 Transcript_12209/m.28741 type:complete len:281 (-) Transcript_12209:27-869(-)